MSVIVFLDEAGNLNLDIHDENFPLFAVSMLVCNTTDYTRPIVPAVLEFKIKHFVSRPGSRPGFESVPIKNKRPRLSPEPVAERESPVPNQDIIQTLHLIFAKQSTCHLPFRWSLLFTSLLESARMGGRRNLD